MSDDFEDLDRRTAHSILFGFIILSLSVVGFGVLHYLRPNVCKLSPEDKAAITIKEVEHVAVPIDSEFFNDHGETSKEVHTETKTIQEIREDFSTSETTGTGKRNPTPEQFKRSDLRREMFRR